MRILLTTTFLLFSCSIFADSYSDSLKELFELTRVQNHYVSLNNTIINQMQTGFFSAADQTFDASSYSEDQKQQVGEILKTRFTGIVKNYQDHVQKTMSYEKVSREVYIPLYKEMFSEKEVLELIKFYKSPVGKKLVEVSPIISNQATERSAKRYDAMIVEFVEKQVRDNIVIAQKEVADQVRK